MAPCCGMVCLFLGVVGIVLFCVGFSLPYWATESGADDSSHGLWQQRACQSGTCDTSYIGFGVTSAFESARVFSCATIVMGFISFVFTIVFLKKPTKGWAIRTAAVWACTALFNFLEVVLIGATVEDTINALALPGLTNGGNLVDKLDYGYWVTVGSLIIFILVALSSGILACTDQVDDVSESGEKKKLHDAKVKYHPDSLAPSMMTSRTGGEILNPSAYNAFPLRYGHGAILQPQNRAAVNIDNQRTNIAALNMPHYNHPVPLTDDYSTLQGGKFILNNPTISPASRDIVSVPTGSGTEISILKQGEPNQDGMYSFNVKPAGVTLPGSSTATMQTQVSGYATIPYDSMMPQSYSTMIPSNPQPYDAMLPSSTQPMVNFIQPPQTPAPVGSTLYPSLMSPQRYV